MLDRERFRVTIETQTPEKATKEMVTQTSIRESTRVHTSMKECKRLPGISKEILVGNDYLDKESKYASSRQ